MAVIQSGSHALFPQTGLPDFPETVLVSSAFSTAFPRSHRPLAPNYHKTTRRPRQGSRLHRQTRNREVSGEREVSSKQTIEKPGHYEKPAATSVCFCEEFEFGGLETEETPGNKQSDHSTPDEKLLEGLGLRAKLKQHAREL